MKHDVVYILKNDIDSDELRYSLRSVVMNFPYHKIVFAGGKPDDINPDIYLEDQQVGSSKWERSKHSLIKALKCDELTDDIWLFNDDFFIMDKVKSDTNYFGGTLEKRILDLRRHYALGSTYIRSLETLKGRLIQMRKDTLSFALHVPMLINRQAALQLLEKKDSSSSMFRSYYGNFYKIDCQFMEDVKVYDLETVPDTPYISTTDESFKDGKVGEFLRLFFERPCKYEKSKSEQLIEDTREIYTEEGEIRYE